MLSAIMSTASQARTCATLSVWLQVGPHVPPNVPIATAPWRQLRAAVKAVMFPFHHANTTAGNTVTGEEEGWYRFLGSVMQRDDQVGPPPEGVVGIEAPDWEQNPLSSQHNVYQGKPGPYASYLESGAIDQKCVGCHSDFHNETVANSTWIRHPVDVAIPDAGEFTGFDVLQPDGSRRPAERQPFRCQLFVYQSGV